VSEHTRSMILDSARYEVIKRHGALPHAALSDVIDALRANPAWAKSLGIGQP
jgi:hypothetical protein